jgi:hypothetical protein
MFTFASITYLMYFLTDMLVSQSKAAATASCSHGQPTLKCQGFTACSSQLQLVQLVHEGGLCQGYTYPGTSLPLVARTTRPERPVIDRENSSGAVDCMLLVLASGEP